MGPNRYSFSDPADFKIIYGLGSKLTKTEYYDPLGSDDLEKDNLFTMKDPIEHNKRRRKVSSLYTMSTMKNYEPAVDKMTRVCIRKMHQFADEGRTISLPDFIQYYAFDVIGEITVRLIRSKLRQIAKPTTVQQILRHDGERR
jgi:cytochrome P450